MSWEWLAISCCYEQWSVLTHSRLSASQDEDIFASKLCPALVLRGMEDFSSNVLDTGNIWNIRLHMQSRTYSQMRAIKRMFLTISAINIQHTMLPLLIALFLQRMDPSNAALEFDVRSKIEVFDVCFEVIYILRQRYVVRRG